MGVLLTSGSRSYVRACLSFNADEGLALVVPRDRQRAVLIRAPDIGTRRLSLGERVGIRLADADRDDLWAHRREEVGQRRVTCVMGHLQNIHLLEPAGVEQDLLS